MSTVSPIEWTEATWNPVTGCTPISLGCDNCYAMRLAKRLKAMGSKNYINGFELTVHPDMLVLPLKWKKPRRIFVNSMSDLFHEDIPLEFIQDVFEVMKKADHHTFQVLTKRAKRMELLAPKLKWPPNVWMGVTVEAKQLLKRIEYLKSIPANIKFISFEPLLTDMNNADLHKIDWVIVGGESGPHSRPIKEEWVNSIRLQCQELDIPFFFKQWGGPNKKKSGRELNGNIYSEMPTIPCQRN